MFRAVYKGDYSQLGYLLWVNQGQNSDMGEGVIKMAKKIPTSFIDGPLGNVHKGRPMFLRFSEIPTYLCPIRYVYLSMYYVRFSLTHLPTQKLDILYERSLTELSHSSSLMPNMSTHFSK
jgi:hypothetical protein